MLKWTEHYSVGVPLFDEQHKKLFDLCNQLFSALDSQAEATRVQDNIEVLILELIRYTQYHFSQEEKMMRLYHFPDYEAHLAEHQNFSAFIDDIDTKALEENPFAVGKEVLYHLIDWITHHIQEVDKGYSAFLKSTFTTKN